MAFFFFLHAGEPRPPTWVLSALRTSRLRTEKLFTPVVRCCAPRPADPAKEGLSCNRLYSDFSLKPSTKKCRLNHLRSDSSSASCLKFLSRMVRTELGWEKLKRHVSKESHRLSQAHVGRWGSSDAAGSVLHACLE